MDAPAWIAAFAEALGIDPPDEPTVTRLLEVAAIAAHGSERPAAPIACYLIGRAGIDPQDGTALARAIAEG